jgi:prophage regulatory protein
MTHRVLIPLPGIGTLSLTHAEYDAALIPIAPAIAPRHFPPSPPPPPPRNRENVQSSHEPVAHRGLRYIRLKEVCARVGLRPSAIYHLISDGRFPKQVKLSERTSAWVVSEVETYMDARIAERDAKRPAAGEAISPYLRMGEVLKITGLNSSTLYDLIREGKFPKWAPLPKIASGWTRGDIEEWLALQRGQGK